MSSADISARIQEGPFSKTQGQSVGTKEGRFFAYFYPIFSTFPGSTPQLTAPGSPRMTRASGFISQMDHEDISVWSKRSNGWYEKAGKFAAHCTLFELNETCGKRAAQNFLSEIFLAQFSLRSTVFRKIVTTEEGLREITILKIIRLMEVKRSKSFILVHAAVVFLRIAEGGWGIKGQEPNIR